MDTLLLQDRHDGWQHETKSDAGQCTEDYQQESQTNQHGMHAHHPHDPRMVRIYCHRLRQVYAIGRLYYQVSAYMHIIY